MKVDSALSVAYKCPAISILLYSPFQKIVAFYPFLLRSTNEVERQEIYLNKIQYLPKRTRSRQKTFNITALIHKYKPETDIWKNWKLEFVEENAAGKNIDFSKKIDFKFYLEE